jgi:hypothetical protein
MIDNDDPEPIDFGDDEEQPLEDTHAYPYNPGSSGTYEH